MISPDRIHFIFEGHDCVGKDFVRREFDHFMNFKYVTHVRDIISCFVYDVLVKRPTKNIVDQLDAYNRSENVYYFVNVTVSHELFMTMARNKKEPISNVRTYSSFDEKYRTEKQMFNDTFVFLNNICWHRKLVNIKFAEISNVENGYDRKEQYRRLIARID